MGFLKKILDFLKITKGRNLPPNAKVQILNVTEVFKFLKRSKLGTF